MPVDGVDAHGDLEQIVEVRRTHVLEARFDDRHDNALGLNPRDRMAESTEQLHAHDLEVGEVVAVVHDAGGVGLGVAHAHARRKT